MGIVTAFNSWKVIITMIADRIKQYKQQARVVTQVREETKMGQKVKLGKVDIRGYEKWFKYVDKEGNVFAVERSSRSQGKKKE